MGALGSGDDTGAAAAGGQGEGGDTMELWHVYSEPLFGRHMAWDDANLRLSNVQQVRP